MWILLYSVLILIAGFLLLAIIVAYFQVKKERKLERQKEKRRFIPEEKEESFVIEKKRVYEITQLHENGKIRFARSIDISFTNTGCLHVYGLDGGSWLQEADGTDGYEFYLNLDSENTDKLFYVLQKQVVDQTDPNGSIMQLLIKKYDGKPETMEDIMEICKENQIEFQFDRW